MPFCPPTPSAPRPRWRSLAVCVLLLAAGTGPLVLASRAEAATALYPDLGTLPPRDLRMDVVPIGGVPHDVLRFTNTVINRGPGKLDVVGVIDPTTLSGPAQQRVYDTDGNYTSYDAGTFTWHAAHQHFHYDGWGRYELWSRADYDSWLASGRSRGLAKKVGTKTTSCIIDEELVAEGPSTPAPGPYGAGGCQLQPDSTLHEGMSPGWGDTYDWYRDEQWIDLDQTPLADGAYVLRSVADPNDQLRESAGGDPAREGQADNEAVTAFTVTGGQLVDGAPPTGTITIDDQAATTADSDVVVKALGRDDVSGVDQVRLSEDGVSWRTFGYTPNSSIPTSIAWSLLDPTVGGSATTGTRTVYAQFHDAAGSWGPTATDTIGYAPAAPPPPPPPVTVDYASTVAGDSPLAYWRLGETTGTTARDTTARHPGTYRGGVRLGSASLLAGDADTAVTFDGVTGAVAVPDAADLRLRGALTLEAWVRLDRLPAPSAAGVLIGKAGAYSLELDGTQLTLALVHKKAVRRLRAQTGAVTVGRTAHVVGVYDGAVARLYVDGSVVATAADSGPVVSSTSTLLLGGIDTSGVLDEVAVYARALSATDVARHRLAGVGQAAATTTVSAVVSGTGTGHVTSVPSGISCPATCSTQVASGSAVTLTATADAGSTFTGWTAGACTGTTPTCTFTAVAVTSATATFGTASAYTAAVLADSPLSYWRLGDASGITVTDATGRHPGTYLGTQLGQPSLLAADPDRSVLLDGATSDVRVPSAPDLQLPGAFTVEAWLRPQSLPPVGGWASIVSKAESWSLQLAGPQLELTVIQSGVRRRLRAPAGALVVGRTAHVVGTYDGAVQSLYIDGVPVVSAPLTGWATPSTSDVHLGSWDGGSERFAGQLDEIAVYGTALSAARVQAHDAAAR